MTDHTALRARLEDVAESECWACGESLALDLCDVVREAIAALTPAAKEHTCHGGMNPPFPYPCAACEADEVLRELARQALESAWPEPSNYEEWLLDFARAVRASQQGDR